MQPTFNLSAYQVETIKELVPVRVNQRLDLNNKSIPALNKLNLLPDFFPLDSATGQTLIGSSRVPAHIILGLVLESIDFLDMFAYMFETTSSYSPSIIVGSDSVGRPVPPLNKLGIETLSLYFSSSDDAASLRMKIGEIKSCYERETETTQTMYGQTADRRFDPTNSHMYPIGQSHAYPGGACFPFNNGIFNPIQPSPVDVFFQTADMLKDECDLEVLEFSGNARSGVSVYLEVSKITEKLTHAFYGATVSEVVPAENGKLKVRMDMAPIYGGNMLADFQLEHNRRTIKAEATNIAFALMTTDYELTAEDIQKLNTGRLTNKPFETKEELAKFLLELIAK